MNGIIIIYRYYLFVYSGGHTANLCTFSDILFQTLLTKKTPINHQLIRIRKNLRVFDPLRTLLSCVKLLKNLLLFRHIAALILMACFRHFNRLTANIIQLKQPSYGSRTIMTCCYPVCTHILPLMLSSYAGSPPICVVDLRQFLLMELHHPQEI